MTFETLKKINVSVLGPSRSGKTTLISVLNAEIGQFLKDINLMIKPIDEHQVAINALIEQINLTINTDDLKFQVEKVQGTAMTREYSQVIFNQKIQEIYGNSLQLNFLDFPGGDLMRNDPNWEKTKQFMLNSKVVLVPIDAMLVMESNHPRYEKSVHALLGLNALSMAIDELVKARVKNVSFIFVPVKCENYFSDNGGLFNKSQHLFDKSMKLYEEIKNKMMQVTGSKIYYVAVDTLGVVDLVDVKWEATGRTDFEYAPTTHYRIRRDRTDQNDTNHQAVVRKGVNNLIKIIFKENLILFKDEIDTTLQSMNKGFINTMLNYFEIERQRALKQVISDLIIEISKIKTDERMKEIHHV
jgi:hypothetical protein